jgi:hypothetical protein
MEKKSGKEKVEAEEASNPAALILMSGMLPSSRPLVPLGVEMSWKSTWPMTSIVFRSSLP